MDKELQEMIDLVEECIKLNKTHFLANVLYKIKKEYQQVCELSTDGAYKTSWTHKMVLDHLTYEPKL